MIEEILKLPKNEEVLQTGLRLIGILKALYDNNLTKNEIKSYLVNNYNLKLSDETLKLDINTLIKVGFKIKRGNKGNGFKIHLDKNFSFLKFNKSEICFIEAIKNFTLDNSDFEAIFNLKNFIKKITPCLPDIYKNQINDFKFFGILNEKIIDTIKYAIENKKVCKIIYNIQENGKTEFKILPEKIFIINGKLYFSSYEEYQTKEITFRFDNILSVQIMEEANIKKFFNYKPLKIQKTSYKIAKEFYKNHFLNSNEEIIAEDENFYEIQINETSDFFITQRITTLGTNCISLNNIKIKNDIIKNLKETLEVYK